MRQEYVTVKIFEIFHSLKFIPTKLILGLKAVTKNHLPYNCNLNLIHPDKNVAFCILPKISFWV